MKAIVIYESMFGNTEEIAAAVIQGLRRFMEVELVEVGAAATVDVSQADLLVVGAPTHAHGLSRVRTREAAAKDAGDRLVSRGQGVREWLDSFPQCRHCPRAAAFDTRFDKPRLITGSAARKIAARLRHKGFHLVAPPQSFFVRGTEGSLAEGELERAAIWGGWLSEALERAAA